MRIVRWLAIFVVLLLAVAGYFAWDWYRVQDAQLSVVPERQASPIALKPRESSAAGSVFVAHATLQRAMQKLADRLAGSKSDRTEIRCIRIDIVNIRECLDVNWTVNYRRDGTIRVGRAKDLLRITIPASFDGQAEFGGGLAKQLRLPKRPQPFDGSFTITVATTLSLDQRYCPVLRFGEIDFQWRQAGRVQVLDRTRVTISGVPIELGPYQLEIGRLFTNEIRSALRKALADAARTLPCEPIRKTLADAWKTYSFPVNVANAPAMFVNVDPRELSTAPLRADGKGVHLAFRASALVVAAAERGPEKAKPLPAHKTISAPQGRLSFAVPLRVSYEQLREETAKALLAKPFVVGTDAGEAQLTLEDVQYFPSGERIAIGVRFSAKLPWRAFDALGTVWLTGQPVVEAKGTVLRLADVRLTRQIDNELWRVASVVMQERIAREIENHARYDFTRDAQSALDALRKTLEDPARTPGFRMRLNKPQLALGRIQLEERTLALEAVLESGWNAVLQEIRF